MQRTYMKTRIGSQLLFNRCSQCTLPLEKTVREANAISPEGPVQKEEAESPALPKVWIRQKVLTELMTLQIDCSVFGGVNQFSVFVSFHVLFETSLRSQKKEKTVDMGRLANAPDFGTVP